jgi:integrase
MNQYRPVKHSLGAGQLLRHVTDPNRWMARVFISRDSKNRKQYQSQVVHGSRKEAEAVLATMLQRKRTGSLTPRSNMRLADLANEWVTHKAPTVSHRTLRGYEDALHRYVLPSLGHRKLSDITLREIDRLYGLLANGEAPQAEGKRRLSGSRLGPRTIQIAHSVLSQMLAQAVKWELLQHNPAAGATRPPLRTQERKPIPIEERGRFLTACQTSFYGALYRFLVDTGVRPGEACGLRWSDVDLAAGRAVIRHAVTQGVGGEPVLADPKTPKSRRTVHLTMELRDELLGHQDWQRESGLDKAGFVFTNSRGAFLRPWTFPRRDLERTAQLAGIRTRVTLYTLRHTFATMHLANGTPLKIVSTMLGHSNISQTADTYQHADEQVTAEWMHRFEKMLATVASEERPPVN